MEKSQAMNMEITKYGNTRNALIQNVPYNIDDQLEARMAKFSYMCLNHDNDVCRSISLSKLC